MKAQKEEFEFEKEDKTAEVYDVTKGALARIISEGIYLELLRSLPRYRLKIMVEQDPLTRDKIHEYLPTLNFELDKCSKQVAHPIPELPPEEVKVLAQTVLDEIEKKEARQKWIIGLVLASGIGAGGLLLKVVQHFNLL